MISSTLDPFLHFPVLWNVGSIITIANYLLIRVSIPIQETSCLEKDMYTWKIN